MNKIEIYLIARISEDAHMWNNKVCDVLSDPIKVFMPQKHNPYNILHTMLSKEVYDMDIETMKKSDLALALPEFGNDCSYEVGWFSNANKPIIFYVDTQTQWLRNWMVKGGLDYVVTTNQGTFEILQQDSILKTKKVVLIKDIEELNQVISKVFEEITL